VVIIDTGEKIMETPGMDEFAGSNLAIQDETGKFIFAIGYTGTYTPPEFADILSGEKVLKVKTEQFMVYQLGILLLQSFYNTSEVYSSILLKNGKSWIDRAGDHFELRRSVNQNTITDLLERIPKKEIPETVARLLTSMVNENPSSRPKIDEVTRVLKETISKTDKL
jgi:hypothetical protein